MIITKTPFRISFLGGGTDYPSWYRDNGGAVLSTSIDKYCYISCRKLPPFFEHKHRIVYSLIERVRQNSEIQHPAVKAVFEEMDIQDGLEIHHDGDLPARSGLGSSSSFTVGLIHAIHAYRGRQCSKSDLAKASIRLEQNVLKETVGSQDQIAAAYGGLNQIVFKNDGHFEVFPLQLKKARREDLENHLMLFFTGFSRFASQIAKTQLENFENRKNELQTIRSMVDEGIAILQSENSSLSEFGKLLHEGWKLKRSLSSSVSTTEIDKIYETGRSAGAIGGKLLGAGGGGFMLFFVPPGHQDSVRTALKHLVHVRFRFESEGSKIALFGSQV